MPPAQVRRARKGACIQNDATSRQTAAAEEVVLTMAAILTTTKMRGDRGIACRGGGKFVPGSEFSAHMVKKARRLVANCLCALAAEGTWQVCSSDGTSYFVTTEPAYCECLSFKMRRVCSHVLAAQMMDAGVGEESEEEEEDDGSGSGGRGHK